MNQINHITKQNDMVGQSNNVKEKMGNVWAIGDYQSISTMLPPISAHLIKLLKVKTGDTVLDVACGNGNTAILVRRNGASVTGLDNTTELLSLASKEEESANVKGIVWKAGDIQNLPFEDESFDIVISTFGHMFAENPDLAAKEMLRVTKKGGRIGFATWPPELAIGSIFRNNAKHLSKINERNNNIPSPPSPLLWGIPEVVEKRLSDVSEIYFERGTSKFPILSPNHFWQHMSTKYGPLMKVIQTLKVYDNVSEPQSLKNDFLKSIEPYFEDGYIRLGYLLTVARK